MTVVESVYSSAQIDRRYDVYHKDTLTMSWEDRRRGHGRRRSDAGIEFAISLPSGTILKRGHYLVLENEKTVVAIEEAMEPVYIVRPKTSPEWAYYAYHAGNRHQQVMIGETELIFPQNPAVRSLLEQMQVQFETDRRPFTATLSTGHTH
jgi:urease accessory protein UreE